MKRFALFVAAFLLLLMHSSRAHSASGASFLKIPVGARAVGMGNAYTALANDVTALYWNPAGLSGLKTKELGLMHAQLFSDTRYDFVGFAMPIQSRFVDTSRRADVGGGVRRVSTPWSLGVGAVNLGHGAIEGRDDSGNKSGDFAASDLAVNLAASRQMTGRTSMGLNVKALRQSIGGDQANGMAADFGIMTQMPRMNIGLAIQNVGPSMKFAAESYALPLTVSGGLGYHMKGGMTLSFDYHHRPIDNTSSLGFGGELALLSSFSLRGGYLSTLSALQSTQERRDSVVDQVSGLGIGFGLKLFRSQIDYALTPMGELGITQRLSLAVHF